MIKVGDVITQYLFIFTNREDLVKRYSAKVTDIQSMNTPDFKMHPHFHLEFIQKSTVFTDGWYPDNGTWRKVDEFQGNLELETADGKEV
jgi:hypothetical protein